MMYILSGAPAASSLFLVLFFGVQVLCHEPCGLPESLMSATGRGAGPGGVDGSEDIASWPGAALWDVPAMRYALRRPLTTHVLREAHGRLAVRR
jgi:hypothetical protein